MARPPSPGLTDAELRVMRVLWEQKRATVGTVVERLAGPHTLAYNTVLTTLGILERKGYVTHEKDGRAFAYRPVVDQSEARHTALSQVLNRFFDDSPRLLVLDLLGHERTDADELRRVRELIEHAPPDAGDATPQEEAPPMTFILTWLWQGLAIAWITAAAVRAMPRLNAATRHAVWWLALAAVLAIPAAHGLGAIATGRPSDGVDAVDAARALALPAIPDAVVVFAAVIWAITAALGVLRIAKDCCAVVRLKRTSSPFDRSREERLPLWAARDSTRRAHRAAELRTSDSMTGACALGLGRPVILVSHLVADALSDKSLDEVVMHEQAHLDRYDDWSQLLLAIVSSVAGLHPAVRFLARRLAVDREAACDDRVVSCTGDTRRYAFSLLAVAAASKAEAGRIKFAPTATTTASALRVRVGRLLDPRRDRGRRLARATSLVTATALTLAVGVSTQLAPVVIFIETATVNTPAAPAAAVALAIEVRRTPEPASRTNVNAAARESEPTPGRAPARSKRATRSDPLEAGVRPFAGTTLDAHPTAPDIIAADAVASVPAMPLPSSQPAAIASAPILTAAPWNGVGTSAASAANDIARAASEAGARARNAGVSIGRFVTRASKAGASVF